ncbi:MAG: hypothetical protein KGI80_00560 [Verrucomicrobiota bacterium]|nr:hypothetical protein [Verrucomicrobiota bacterium]
MQFSLFNLLFLLFLWTQVPKVKSDSVRGWAMTALGSSWQWGEGLSTYLAHRPWYGAYPNFFGISKQGNNEDLVAELRLQNQMLRAQLELAREWILQEKGAERRGQLDERLDKQEQFLLAKVIYRVPSSWNQSCWIDVGEEAAPLLSRNSPVVYGNALVGVVDFVGKRQSRVRLITDPGMNVSVRVERENGLYLAKGIVRGLAVPFWSSSLLKGVGFNYSYADSFGAAQDLESVIIQEGDHLITSGFDGLFPFGLSVATVTKIDPRLEGNFSYSLSAIPTAPALNDMHWVSVLPASGE